LSGVDHRFATANSPWTNGIGERMMLEVIRILKAMLSEGKYPVSYWVNYLPAVQWMLNTEYRER
ncbi:unnamed protein product, partial [Choristocarpus tenellus]